MARRSEAEKFFDDLENAFVVVPAWVGPVVAAGAFVLFRFLVPALCDVENNPKNIAYVAFSKPASLIIPLLILFVWVLALIRKASRRR